MFLDNSKIKFGNLPCVTAVGNGQEAVRAFEAAAPPFDAVLLDNNMPLMSGLARTPAAPPRAGAGRSATTSSCSCRCLQPAAAG